MRQAITKGAIYSCLFAILFLSIRVVSAQAAVLSLSPAAGGFTAGQTFSVRVVVSSPDQAMNAVSGVVSFPASLLEATGISKSGSIVNLWVQEPSFSNEAGTASFEGVVLNPGWTGTSGTVTTLTFRAKASGVANLRFTSGSVLANDGQGTNILSSLGTGAYTIGGSDAGDTTSPAPSGTPLAPQIVSPTHPSPDRWYSSRNPKFSWEVPAGVTAIRLSYNAFPVSIPTVLYAPAIAEKTLENVSDGVYYLHAQFRNANGWGAVTHRRFQIDTVPPNKFTIAFVDENDTANPRPTALFNTTDETSGIDFYKVKLGDKDFVVVRGDEVAHNPYTLPASTPGKQTILVQAFDRAGNYETALAEVNILSLPAPVITAYPERLAPGEFVVVKGRTVPEATVTVWLEREGATPRLYTSGSGAEGDFTIAGDGEIPAGVYELWVEAVDARGARTLPSAHYTVAVESPAIVRIGSIAVSLLATVVSVVALLILLAGICWYAWRHVFGLKKKVGRDVRQAERDIEKEFERLRESVRKHLKLLERAKTVRELTSEEEKILIYLKGDVDVTESVVDKKIEEIKKDLD